MDRLCLADIAGPFYDPAKPFRNWSALPYYQLDRSTPPFVDQRQLTWGVDRACAYIKAIQAQGYNGIVIDNLAHLVSFEQAPIAIYPPNSPERQRAIAYRNGLAPLFRYAAACGMRVFVTSDMQWSTPALRRYIGRMKPDNPRLADANRWALAELFRTFPEISGLFIRFGEAGGAHDQDGYQGHMIYTGVEELRTLIDTLLPVCEQHERTLVVRTWSIGIGELGDLIWSPERYQAAFASYTSPFLLTSVKHGPMDFFRFLPHNPTLGLPGPRQIIELQNRREYELFGMVPSSVASLHQSVLQRAAPDLQFAGVWAWNGSGGWGGGRAALGDDGWSLWTELSSALTSALVANPDCDTEAFVRSWCAKQLGGEWGAAVADLYLESAALIEHGWYIGPLKQGVLALGMIYLPTLLWVWWMRPTASLLIWAYLATALPDPQAALRAGALACDRAAFHAARIARFAPAHHPTALGAAYLADVLTVAHAVRSGMLGLAGAAQAGDRKDWYKRAGQAMELRERLQAHERRWATDPTHTPLELGEVERFLLALHLRPDLLWRQARLAVRLCARLRLGRIPRRRLYLASGFGAAALLTGLLACKSRRSAGLVGALASSMLVPSVRRRVVHATFPWVSRRLYLLPSIFFETGPAFTEWSG
ncbi:MAG: hypothetical protein SH847_19265 [Roseiflexaceae bacterium]|nr:hypothetical protein [Roseiflexaceae bacterium]